MATEELTLPLSVIVTSRDPWPAVRDCVESLVPQAKALGAEILVAASSGCEPPVMGDYNHPPVRWITVPSTSPFTLRAAALPQARGTVVALTEDHCMPAADWCEKILSAHSRRADVDVIGGAIRDRPGNIVERASYWLTFGPFVPPFGATIPRLPVAANVSVKRRALAALEPVPGAFELGRLPALAAAGKVAFDDSITITHIQYHGVCGTFVIHFHNGRTTAALRTERMRWTQILRHPLDMISTALSAAWRQPALWGTLLKHLPVIVGLALCHVAGEAVGTLWGPGCSPEQLH